MYTLFPRHRKVSTRLALVAALTMGLLAVSVSPALATTYSDGNGDFVAVSHLNPPPQQCATYSLYNASLVVGGNSKVVKVSSSTNPLSSTFQWGEFFDGTYKPQTSATGFTSCKKPADGPGATEGGFTGTLVGAGVNCNLGTGTYQRGALGTVNPELNIKFVFNSVSGSCTGISTPVTIRTTIPSVDDPTDPDPAGYISLCNSPIAPQSCVLGPALGTW